MADYYLLDTCIWRDFYENRFSKSGRPLGKYASDLIIKIIKNKGIILYSNSLLCELNKDYNEIEIKDMLNILFISNILKSIEITKEEFLEGKKLSKEKNLPFIDCLNAIQARNYCAIMVSQDFHFLENLKDIIKTKRPEEIN